MLTHTSRLAAASVVLALLVSACTNSRPTAAPATSPTPTSASLEIKSPNTPEELLAALPSRYGKRRLEQQSGVLLGWPLGLDWLKGHRVEPESCGLLLRTGGQTDTTFVDWPPFPQAVAADTLNTREFEVTIYSLQPPYGDRYLDLLDQPAPHCTKFMIDGKAASVIDRPVPGLGSRSRYILRTYPYKGRIHRRAVIHFSTPTYAVAIDARSGTYTEPTLLAFAHQVQALADQKLR